MADPNFSESQFQQAANTAIIRRMFEMTGKWSFANVVSLCDEAELGWDTAFFFDHMAKAGLPDHHGCNFFLQYKLSSWLKTNNSAHWAHWEEPYFRFKIPHSTQKSGASSDDYHQWDRLKELANKGYPVFYATNQTLCKGELRASHDAGDLPDAIAMLDVRDVSARHKHVTFTKPSAHFNLHSELVRLEKASFDRSLEGISSRPHQTMREADDELIRALLDISPQRSWLQEDIAALSLKRDGQTSEDGRALSDRGVPFVRHAKLRAILRRHIGVELLWCPAKGSENISV